MVMISCGRYMRRIRLIRAGDIESNPGPKDAPSVRIRHEKMFLDLSRKIEPSSYNNLGNSLGFNHSELSTVERKHQMDTQGALMEILCSWRDRQSPGTDIISVLKEKLRECNLHALTDTRACSSRVPEDDDVRGTSDGSTNTSTMLSNEQVQQCKKDLKEYYKVSRRKVTVDPLNFMERVNLDEIYTNLSLVESAESKKEITYENLVTNDEDGNLSKRRLIQGEGGVGKTTLCAKIAWDWCQGRILQDLDMVLVIPLRDVTNDESIGCIVEHYLSDSNAATTVQLDDYILKKPDRVLLVFDGFDEFRGKMEEKSNSEIIRILGMKQYKSCKVIVTTRPWRIHEFTMAKDLADAYTFVIIEGFKEGNVSSYIEKYFRIRKKDALGESLISFMMEESDVIRLDMAPFPIYCAMLCLMWKECTEERRTEMRKMQTFSEIFGEMIAFLKEHYTSKICKHLEDRTAIEPFEEASRAIQDISEIALNGLFDKNLSFPEDQFTECHDAMKTCCKVGVLTIEKHLVQRRRRRNVNSQSLVLTKVSFPHKLFQEYIAGLYLEHLYDKDREKFDQLKTELFSRFEEFRYLLYFTSALRSEISRDIMEGLINHADQYFCVDVAFECHAEDTVKVVGEKWKAYTVSNKATEHTRSGVAFMVNCKQAQTLSIEDVNCGKVVSRDLVEGMCSSSVLRKVQITHSPFQSHFYKTIGDKASLCQIQELQFIIPDRKGNLKGRFTEGTELAKWVCTMPRISSFNVDGYYLLPDTFFSTAAELAQSAKIQDLTLFNDWNYDFQYQSSVGKECAQWVCSMPRLSSFFADCFYLSDSFFSVAADLAESCKISDLTLIIRHGHDGGGPFQYKSSMDEDLARWVCTLPHLSNFSIEFYYMPADFFSTAASMVGSCQVRELSMVVVTNWTSESAAEDFAEFLCQMPHLERARISGNPLPRTFFKKIASQTTSCEVEAITINEKPLNQLLSGN